MILRYHNLVHAGYESSSTQPVCPSSLDRLPRKLAPLLLCERSHPDMAPLALVPKGLGYDLL